MQVGLKQKFDNSLYFDLSSAVQTKSYLTSLQKQIAPAAKLCMLHMDSIRWKSNAYMR